MSSQINVSVLESLLEDLAESLQIPPSRYEAAERSFKSVGEWLQRDASTLRNLETQIYIQGSFRLGTAIRPISGEDDYDVDLVCEVGASKNHVTQRQLKEALGRELRAYAVARRLEEPDEGRRCWTLNYADDAQFHLDTLPAIPDGARKRLLLEQSGLSTEWAQNAIAITDRNHRNYDFVSEDWPHSNPKGYSEWFRSRMTTLFEQSRRVLALEAQAEVEDIPEYRVRTPLQSAIQILKRHRDVMFVDSSDDKPISIVLTTLAAHAYGEETTIGAALYAILAAMESHIEDRNGISWIANPTDPAENFADKWQEYPERRDAFFRWLGEAQSNFEEIRYLPSDDALDFLQPHMGEALTEEARTRQRERRSSPIGGGGPGTGISLDPAHREEPPWPRANVPYTVSIVRASVVRNGHRTSVYPSNGYALPKGKRLRFFAETDVALPYDVFWQVVNTGEEAARKGGLRGGFDNGPSATEGLERREHTDYRGKHSIECFVVKSGCLVARSGQFLVNVQ